MDKIAMARSLVGLARLLMAKDLTASTVLQCVEGGLVEVVIGEAHSAEVRPGNLLVVTKEDRLRYYGKLDIHGASFRHDPGLSGKPPLKGPFQPGSMEFAVLKETVGENADSSHGFWATWAVK